MEVSALCHNTRPEWELLPQEKEVYDELKDILEGYQPVK